MKNFSIRLALGAMSIAGAVTAHAASDYLLMVDGVQGETETKGRASVQQFRWTQAFDARGGFDPFHPALAGGVRMANWDLSADSHWDSMTLTALALDGQPFVRYELKDVVVSSYSISGHGATANTGPWIQLKSASGPTLSWAPPTPNGGRGDWVHGHWASATGGFVGDRAVFGAFADLGATRLADGSLAIAGAVPEPGTWALMLGGLAATGFVARRRVAFERKSG